MKYGVKLLSYDNEPVHMWVYNTNGRFETESKEIAQQLANTFHEQNPKGLYQVQQIE